MVAIALGIPAGATAARAEFFYNLDVGLAWEYDGHQGEHDRQEVTRTDDLDGVEVRVIRFFESTYNEGLENFWSVSEEGDLLLWGFDRTLEGIGFLYDPPVAWVDAPLEPGKEWTQDFSIYSLQDGSYVGEGRYVFHVRSAGDVEVPHGTYYAYEVEATGSMEWDQPLSLSACGLRNVTVRTTDWWSEGIGRIRYDSGPESYLLTDFIRPTPVRETSWGRIKALNAP
jgi:hypothetical protein